MKTSHILTTLAVVSALAIINVAAAAQGNLQGGNGQREEVKQAIENNDYNAWAELMADAPHASDEMLGKINAENFHLLNEMHQARQDGDLGIKAGPFGKKMHEEVQTALENRDYNAWHEAMMPPVFQYVNEGNFNTFADMHEAMKSGDKETAESLREQLGLPEKQAPARGAGNGAKAE